MFPRTKIFTNKDGSQRHYLYLVENRKLNGAVKQITVANLGRLDLIQPQLGELIEKLTKFTQQVQVIDLAQEMKAEWTKEYGPLLIFQKLWEELGLNNWLRRYQEGSKYQFDLATVIFAMVLNRLMEPHSKLGTHEWAKGVYGLPEIELNHWYRAIDFLMDHKEKLEQDLFHQLKNLFNQEVDMVLLDTTSIVYWGEAEAAPDLVDYGFSKEKRFDLKQVIVGIIMTKEGLPIGHEIYPGNTNDVTAFEKLLDSVGRRFKLRRVIFVCDRGMVSKKNLRALEQNNYEYIVGVRMRQMEKEEAEKLLNQSGLKQIKPNLQAKELRSQGKRYIACYNAEQAEKDCEQRTEILARLKEKLKTGGLKSILVHREYSKYLKIVAEKPKLDEEKIKQEKIYDGKYVLLTNSSLAAKDVVLSYKDLWQIEAGFRTLKSELEMGPIYHWTETRIRGHIFICFLALVLRVALKKKLYQLDKNAHYSRVLADLKQMKVVQVTIKKMTYVLRTELQGLAHLAFKVLKLRPPSRILSPNVSSPEKVVVRQR